MLNFIYRRGLKSANVEYINALASFKVQEERKEGREGGRRLLYKTVVSVFAFICLVLTPGDMPSLPLSLPRLPPSLPPTGPSHDCLHAQGEEPGGG